MASVKVEYEEYRTPAACDCCGDDWGCSWRVTVDEAEIAKGDTIDSVDATLEAMRAVLQHFGHTVEIKTEYHNE